MIRPEKVAELLILRPDMPRSLAACMHEVVGNLKMVANEQSGETLRQAEWRDELLTDEPPRFFQHLGLYAYRRDFLLGLAKLPRTPLEMLENLEQLRVLESGKTILVSVVEEPSIGIDTPEDYREFVRRTKRESRVAG